MPADRQPRPEPVAPADPPGPVATDGVDPAEEIAWLKQAAGVLRRSHPDVTPDGVLDLLERRTVEGLRIPVLGTAGATARPGAALTDRAGGWDIRSLVVVPEHGQPEVVPDLVEQELSGGATSVWLRWPGSRPDIDLRGVPLDGATIALDCDDIPAAARALAAAVAEGRGRPAADTVCAVDPFAAAVRAGAATPGPDPDAVRRLVGTVVDVAEQVHVRAFAVDGSAAHDVGAGDAAELGWALAVAVDLLRVIGSSGHTAAGALDLLEIRLAATVQQYPTLAKMRAARLLWARLAEVASLPAAPLRLHAVTSRAMLTRHDPETNQLRTTVAAFAAGAGGADAVTVLPYDAARGVPSRSPRRWARSISLLLQAESHVARTADPAAGAFALEDLTDRLAAAAWAEFQCIEAAGGAAAALADGSVRRRWAATADERQRRVAHREQAVIGVSVYPPVSSVTGPPEVGPDGLGWSGIRRWAEDFEVLQDHPAGAGVFVLPLGSVAAHQSAVGFAVDVFTAGGIPTVVPSVPPGGTPGPELVREFVDSGCAAVCLAGPTDAADATALIDGLRGAGARRAIAAADSAADAVGLDDRIVTGDDVVAFLQRTRDHLHTAEPSHREPSPGDGVRPAQGASR